MTIVAAAQWITLNAARQDTLTPLLKFLLVRNLIQGEGIMSGLGSHIEANLNSGVEDLLKFGSDPINGNELLKAKILKLEGSLLALRTQNVVADQMVG